MWTTGLAYGFDVWGFLHLPQVLTAVEVAAWTRAIDAVGRADGIRSGRPIMESLLARSWCIRSLLTA